MPDSSGDSSIDIEGELQSERITVFENETLLEPNKIVDEDRIYGRDRQLKSVIRLLKPSLDGVPPKDMILHGPSGTGKSLIVGTVANKLVRVANQRGQEMAYIELNCENIRTEDNAVYKMVTELADHLGIDANLSKQGISTSDKYDRFFEIIGEHLDLVILILDELDRLTGTRHTNNEYPAYSGLLYNLSRATDIAGLDNQISIAALTNDAESLTDNIDSRAKSSFNPRDVLFDDYNANELREILFRREDAFREGTLTDDVIPLTAAYAAQGEGDARKAIDLLRVAGEIADMEGVSEVTEHHARRAQEEIEEEYTMSIIQNASIQKQAIIFAAAVAAKYNHTDISGVPGQIAHVLYENITRSVDMDSRSRDSTRDWLDEYVTHSLFESQRKGYGQGKGRHTHYLFQKDPDMVISVLTETDDRLKEAYNERELFREITQKQYTKFLS